MLNFVSSKHGSFHIAQTDKGREDARQILLVCDPTPMHVLDELKQLFYNLVDYIRAKEGVPINLHVFVPFKDNELAEGVDGYIKHNDIDGIVIANEALAQYMGGSNALKHLNYVLPGKGSNKVSPWLPKNKFDRPLTYSVPSNAWLRIGKGIKAEGSGINLLGYVVGALKHTALGEPEIDISYLHDTEAYPVKPAIIKTIKQFDRLIDRLQNASRVAIDSEGTSLNKVKNTLLTLQFCIDYDTSNGQNLFVLPISHRDTPWNAKELRYIQRKLRLWLTRPSKNKFHIYHNAKYDLICFINLMDVQWFETPIYDIMGGVFSLDENTKFLKTIGQSGYSLEAVEARAGFSRPSELVISKDDRGNMSQYTLEEIAHYGAYDVLTIFHLAQKQIEAAKARGYKGFLKLVTRHIGAMQVVFAFMEARGILVDKEYLQQLASPIGPLADRIKQTTQEFYDTDEVREANKRLLLNRKNVQAGGGLFANKKDPFIFSIQNTESLQTLFFDVLDLKPLKDRKDGGGSVDKNFQKAYKSNPLVKLYSAYNKLVKLKSAFADSILKTLNESDDARFDGRIRNSYWFITVLTGRTSATDPNMQQIPSRGEDAKIVQKQFVAPKGKVLLKPDFSAHEIRVTGLISKDKVIKKTFRIANEAIRQLRIARTESELEEARANYKKNGDVHILNVRFFYGLDVGPDHELRTDVKVTVFQTIYGSQAPSLGRQIGKSTEEAQALMDKLFETWSGAKEFMDEVQHTGSKELRVFSPINRPRHLWAYLHPDKFVGYAMNRRGPNSLMQGYASDIGIEAGFLVQEEIYKTFLRHRLNFDGRLLMMVHDSFTNEASMRFAPIMLYLQEHGMTTLVMERMEKVFNFKIDIPFAFDFKIGLSEGEMKKWAELRYEGAEKVFREIAKEGDELHKGQLDDTLYNLERIWKVREAELRNDPYEMRLRRKTKWYMRNMKGLHQV